MINKYYKSKDLSSSCVQFNNMKFPIPAYLDIFNSENTNFYVKEDKELIKKLFILAKKDNSIEKLSNILNLSPRIVYYYIEGKRTPSIKTIWVLLQYLNKNEYKDEIYRQFKGVYTWGHPSYSLPKFFTNELAYITGIICGDGHVSKRAEVEVSNESSDYLKNIVAPIFKRIFNIKPFFVDEGTYSKLIIFSKPANVFFNKVITLPKGKKKGKLQVPEFVYFNKNFKIYFIRGLFETDGGFTCTKNGKVSILISSSTLDFLKQIQIILKDLEINLKGPYKSGNNQGYELRSFGIKQLINFKNRIGLIHPYKNKRLHALIAQFG